MSKKTSKFSRWLFDQRHRDDPVGDLARDAHVDSSWPSEAKDLAALVRYFETSVGYERRATDAAIQALRAAYREWQSYAERIRKGEKARKRRYERSARAITSWLVNEGFIDVPSGLKKDAYIEVLSRDIAKILKRSEIEERRNDGA